MRLNYAKWINSITIHAQGVKDTTCGKITIDYQDTDYINRKEEYVLGEHNACSNKRIKTLLQSALRLIEEQEHEAEQKYWREYEAKQYK